MNMKLDCMDCDTCLLTLKAFTSPCMVYTNSFNRCFHLIWRCYYWWCRSYRIVSYRRIPFYQRFLSDLLMLKRPSGLRVRDASSSTRWLPKKSFSVFQLRNIVTVGTSGLAACWLCSGWHVSSFPANFPNFTFYPFLIAWPLIHNLVMLFVGGWKLSLLPSKSWTTLQAL